ncbi:MAG: carbohydrate ABC transporter permease [Thermomicrobiales bacterium]|nr:MAG: carbohydrate ABC transporter permease [Thermomicrobiales bacterium]
MTSRVNDVETLPLPVEHASGASMLWGRIWRFLQRALAYVVLIVVSIVMIAPFSFLVAGSLMDRGEMFKIPPRLWPSEPIWDNYRTIFTDYAFATYLRNSVIVSLAQTAGVLFFASLAGFIFAKRHFPGRDWLFIFVLITAAMPSGQTTIIPFYLLMVKLHWINTFWPLIIPWWAPPLSIFLMRQYIANGIPDDLIDASRLDGSGLFGTYLRVVLPLSVPGLVVIGIMQFVAIWNDFLYSLLVLKSENMRTATLAIAELSTRTQAATLYGPLFAGIVVVTVPPVVLYFIFQRRLTSGLLSGSIRG